MFDFARTRDDPGLAPSLDLDRLAAGGKRSPQSAMRWVIVAFMAAMLTLVGAAIVGNGLAALLLNERMLAALGIVP